MDKIFNKKVILILVGVTLVCFFIAGLIGFVFRNAFLPGSGGTQKVFYNLSLLAQGNQGKRESFEKKIPVSGKEKIIIDSDVSGITILPCSGKDLLIRYDAFQDSDFKVTEEGNALRIKTRVSSSGQKILTVQNARLELQVPSGYQKDLEIRSDIGSIDLEGDFRILDIHTRVGSLEADASADQILFSSDVGSLSAEGSFLSARLKSRVGSFDFKTDEMREGDYFFSTDVGSVDLIIPADADATLEVSTELGDIECTAAFGKISRQEAIHKRLSAKNKSGAAGIEISTNTGSVTIRN